MNTGRTLNALRMLLAGACLGFFGIPGMLYAQQWQFITGKCNGTALNNTGTMLIVGEHGLIMRSVDNGITWGLPTSNTYLTLQDVAFVNPHEALIVGDEGTLLRSTDDGATWTSVEAVFNGPLDNLAVRSSHVWMTSHNQLLRSSDGGQSWEDPIILPDTALSITMVSHAIGLMVSGDNTIYRTIDSGRSWSAEFIEPDIRFQAVDVSSNGHFGVAGGENSRVYITQDSGKTWEHSILQDTLLNIFDVAVNDKGTITAGGGLHPFGKNILFTTSDTGRNWETVQFAQADGQMAVLTVHTTGDNIGIAATNFGTIIMTQDAWQTIDTITDIRNVSLGDAPISLLSGAFTIKNNGIIANGSAPGGYLPTTDGGITWHFTQYGIGNWQPIIAAGLEHLIMFSNTARELYRTADGGMHWEWLGKDFNPDKSSGRSRAQAIDARTIFQLRNSTTPGEKMTTGLLYHSSDSGRTFEEEILAPLKFGIMSFTTHDMGVLGGFALPEDQDSLIQGYGYGALFLTKDRGRSSKKIYEYTGIENVSGWIAHMVDTNTILLATGGNAFELPGKHVILRSTDQGDNWEISYVSDWQFYDLTAFNDSVWYGVGENAMIVMTTDRGQTWTQEEITPLPRFRFGMIPRFRKVFLLPNDSTAMILGEGTILRKTFPRKFSGVPEKEAVEAEHLLHIYPNPVRDEVFIVWNGTQSLTTLKVFDVLGQAVQIYSSGVRPGEKIKIDISDLVPGIYTIAGSDNQGNVISSGSIIVE